MLIWSHEQVAALDSCLILVLYLFWFFGASCHFSYHSATWCLLDLCCFLFQFSCWVETFYLHVNFSETMNTTLFSLTAVHFGFYLHKLVLKGFHKPGSCGFFSSLHVVFILKLLYYMKKKNKTPELELGGFHRMAKTTVALSFFGWKLCKRSLEWMGWGDNETDGRFYTQPKSENRSQAKAETTAEARRKEESMGLFQITKKIEQLK